MTTENVQAYKELKQLLMSAESARAAAERILMAFPNAKHEASILLGRAWSLFEDFYEKRTGQKLTSAYSNLTNLTALGNIGIEDLAKEMQQLAKYNLTAVGECNMTQGHLEDLCIFLDGEFRNSLKSLKNEYNIRFMTWKYRNHVILTGTCFLLILLALFFIHRFAPKPWHITYFSNANLFGNPVLEENGAHPSEGALARVKAYLQRKGKIKNEWFSARYEGCLKLDSEKEINWSLGSDDGSRLFVDNRQLIDNWGAHAMFTKTTKQLLVPGVHKIKVEYFDQGGAATLELKIRGKNSKLMKKIYATSKNGQCE